MSPLLALSGHTETDRKLSAFGGEADMGRRTVPIVSAASDPKRTKVGLKSRSAAVSCHRGLLSFRSEVPEAPTALRLDS
jgi:hypothetical protein